jgi:hypothetical protein
LQADVTEDGLQAAVLLLCCASRTVSGKAAQGLVGDLLAMAHVGLVVSYMQGSCMQTRILHVHGFFVSGDLTKLRQLCVTSCCLSIENNDNRLCGGHPADPQTSLQPGM